MLPLPTPFTKDEAVDLSGLARNIERWNKVGLSGYVLLGSTGERAHLDEREYLQVIEAAREQVSTDCAFLVGAGQESTHGTISEVKRAAAAGADAVLVITPHFYRPAITQQALIAHYTAVADAAPLPVILYSMPALTGIKIEPETVARLREHQNIIGIKDSSADLEGLQRTVNLLAGAEFAVLTGNGTVLYGALRAGARGAILAVGCPVPQLCLEIIRAVQAEEFERAAQLQEQLTPLATAVTTKYGIGGLKAALELVSFVGGAVRAPLRSPGQEARDEIVRSLKDAQNAIAEFANAASLAAES